MNVTKANGTIEYEIIKNCRSGYSDDDLKILDIVAKIIKAVKEDGDDAVREYTARFDSVLPKKIVIENDELQEYLNEIDDDLKKALINAKDNICDFHNRQLHQSWMKTNKNAAVVGENIKGLNRVGIYISGDTAAYPSSVLINAIPAKIAGVKEIFMVTPPNKDGGPDPYMMAAAAVAGVDRVFLIGGAQAVAALALGTEKIPKVDKIVGSGNIFVSTAKKLLYGIVDVDMISGTAESLIIADDYANPVFLAADLMSQAEHSKNACSMLITTSEGVARATIKEIENQIKFLERQEIIEAALERKGNIIVCESIEKAIALANEFAPAQLQLAVDSPFKYLPLVENAGAVYLGEYSPQVLGDYYVGINHTAPTGGTASFFSSLSVDDFVKRSAFVYYSQNELEGVSDDIVALADTEGLTAHSNSIKVRF